MPSQAFRFGNWICRLESSRGWQIATPGNTHGISNFSQILGLAMEVYNYKMTMLKIGILSH